MNKGLIAVGVGAVVLIGGWLVLSGNKDDAMMKDDAMKKDDTAMMEKTDDTMMDEKKMEGDTMMKDDAMMEKNEGTMMEGDAMMKKGSYEVYSADKLALANSGDVVLFFRATWCPTCKAADADIRANLSNIPSELTILDVDYDNSSELKKKYGVTYQHTFVQVDSKGNLIKKWSGSNTLVALVAQVQ